MPNAGDALAERLAEIKRAGRGAVVVYLLVDRRRRSRWHRWAEALERSGVVAVELGFPFSDPIADGPVLQSAAHEALQHGTNWDDLLGALEIVSQRLPTAVMTYANPLWSRTLPKAMSDLAHHGASGLLLPDVPLEESSTFRRSAHRAGLAFMQLASPATPAARAARIAGATDAFLYLVGHYGTTGAPSAQSTVPLEPVLQAVHRVRPELPVLVGFGVRGPADVARFRRQGADGVVVGTVVETRLARGDGPASVERFLSGLVASAGAFSGRP